MGSRWREALERRMDRDARPSHRDRGSSRSVDARRFRNRNAGLRSVHGAGAGALGLNASGRGLPGGLDARILRHARALTRVVTVAVLIANVVLPEVRSVV